MERARAVGWERSERGLEEGEGGRMRSTSRRAQPSLDCAPSRRAQLSVWPSVVPAAVAQNDPEPPMPQTVAQPSPSRRQIVVHLSPSCRPAASSRPTSSKHWLNEGVAVDQHWKPLVPTAFYFADSASQAPDCILHTWDVQQGQRGVNRSGRCERSAGTRAWGSARAAGAATAVMLRGEWGWRGTQARGGGGQRRYLHRQRWRIGFEGRRHYS